MKENQLELNLKIPFDLVSALQQMTPPEHRGKPFRIVRYSEKVRIK